MPGNADPVPLNPGDDVFWLSPGCGRWRPPGGTCRAGDPTAPIRVRPISRPRPVVTIAIAAKNASSSPPARRTVSDQMRPPCTPRTATARHDGPPPPSATGNPSSVAIAGARAVDRIPCANGWPVPRSAASEIDPSNSVTRKPTPWPQPAIGTPSSNPAEIAAASRAARTEHAPRGTPLPSTPRCPSSASPGTGRSPADGQCGSAPGYRNPAAHRLGSPASRPGAPLRPPGSRRPRPGTNPGDPAAGARHRHPDAADVSAGGRRFSGRASMPPGRCAKAIPGPVWPCGCSTRIASMRFRCWPRDGRLRLSGERSCRPGQPAARRQPGRGTGGAASTRQLPMACLPSASGWGC